EGIMVAPMVVDAPRSHPSRTSRKSAVNTPRILLETRNREDGEMRSTSCPEAWDMSLYRCTRIHREHLTGWSQ
ncbi:hypothetical protein BD311DRAFT_648401, partial [Dichomitus squalens]